MLIKQLTHWGEGLTPSVNTDYFCKGVIDSVGLVVSKGVKHIIEDRKIKNK